MGIDEAREQLNQSKWALKEAQNDPVIIGQLSDMVDYWEGVVEDMERRRNG